MCKNPQDAGVSRLNLPAPRGASKGASVRSLLTPRDGGGGIRSVAANPTRIPKTDEMNAFLIRYRGLLLASVLLSLFLWRVPLHTQDGPNHTLVAVTLARLAGSPAESAVYRSQLGPFQTNTLFPLLYRPASAVLSPGAYEKAFMAVFLVLLLIAYRVFLSVWSPRSGALWVLGLPLVFHPLFITGMYNFLASVPLTLIALALMRRGVETHRWQYFVGFLACSWIILLAHPFPFFVLPIALVVLAVTESKTRGMVMRYYGPVTLVFLVLGFLIPLFTASAGVNTGYTFKALPSLLGGLLVYNAVGYSVLHLVLTAPFFIMLLGLLAYSGARCRWQDRVFWMVLLLGYFVFPNEGNGGAHLNERFLPFAWCVLPIGMVLNGVRLRAVQVVSVTTALIMSAGVLIGMRRIAVTVESAREVLDVVPGGSRLYPVNFDPMGPALTYSSLMHLWAVYDHDKTVYSPYLFAYMDLMPLTRREPASTTYFPATAENFPEQIATNRICRPTDAVEAADCALRRAEGFREILRHAEFYDYWFIHQPPAAFVRMMRSLPGVTLVIERDESSLWSNEGARPFLPALQ